MEDLFYMPTVQREVHPDLKLANKPHAQCEPS